MPDLHTKSFHDFPEMLASRRVRALGGAGEDAYEPPHDPSLGFDVVTWDDMGLGLGVLGFIGSVGVGSP